MTEQERSEVLERLRTTQESLLRCLQGVSPGQLAFRPGADRWSIAEIAEHLVLMEGSTLPLLKHMLATAHSEEPAPRKDESIVRVIRNRARKAQAPEAMLPAGRYDSVEQIESMFRRLRGGVLRYVETCNDDLRGHVYPHPAVGELDGYQWLLFVNAHVERHMLQIEEVKKSAGYPAE